MLNMQTISENNTFIESEIATLFLSFLKSFAPKHCAIIIPNPPLSPQAKLKTRLFTVELCRLQQAHYHPKYAPQLLYRQDYKIVEKHCSKVWEKRKTKEVLQHCPVLNPWSLP